MTALNKQALREAAENATAGQWVETRGEVTTADYEVEGVTLLDHICNCEIVGTESPNAKFIAAANPATVLALLNEMEAAEKRIAELLSENAGLKNSVENAAGCINAAYAEGLIDVLSESNDDRLVDLVKRRLLFAYLPVETPATNEELIAMGDWVLREQLEDGTSAIKTLNRRIAELEAGTVTLPKDAEHDFMAPVVAYFLDTFNWDGSAVRWDGRKEYDLLADRVKYALNMVFRRAAGIGVKGE